MPEYLFDNSFYKTPDRPTVNIDHTWPRPLPTDDDLRAVFFNQLSGPATFNPEEHLGRVKGLVTSGEQFDSLLRNLHGALTVRSAYNYIQLSGQNMTRGLAGSTPFISHMGINRHSGLRKAVHYSLRPVMTDIVNEDADPQVKLNTLALTLGTIIAEAQSMSDGNTRIARSMHDYIRGGLEGLSVERSMDSKRNFIPPQDIEMLVMMQSLAHLIKHPDEPALSDEYITAVPDDVLDLYAQAEDFMRGIWQVDESDYEQGLNPAEIAQLHHSFYDRIRTYVSNTSRSSNDIVRAVLTQKKYAPAAMAAAFSGDIPTSPVRNEDIDRLLDVNNDLMKMRTYSLGLGMARRGIFLAVEKNRDGRQFVSRDRRWLPGV